MWLAYRQIEAKPVSKNLDSYTYTVTFKGLKPLEKVFIGTSIKIKSHSQLSVKSATELKTEPNDEDQNAEVPDESEDNGFTHLDRPDDSEANEEKPAEMNQMKDQERNSAERNLNNGKKNSEGNQIKEGNQISEEINQETLSHSKPEPVDGQNDRSSGDAEPNEEQGANDVGQNEEEIKSTGSKSMKFEPKPLPSEPNTLPSEPVRTRESTADPSHPKPFKLSDFAEIDDEVSQPG